jgi:outer membrane murein-binding lipoprotein Lpp
MTRFRAVLAFGAVTATALFVVSCGVDRTEHETVIRERDELAGRVKSLESDNEKLTADLKRLRETDQGTWDELLTRQKRERWTQVEETANKLISRWPASPLASQARPILRSAREKITESIYEDAQKAIESDSMEKAKSALERLANDYGETPLGRRARGEIESLERKIEVARKERAKQARAAAQERARANSSLELTAFSWHTQHSYAIVEGMVKNISSASLDNVQAVAFFNDSSGNFITSGDALIEYRPILPGQSSPFKVMAPENPAMKTCRVEFKKMFGSEIPTFHSWRKD